MIKLYAADGATLLCELDATECVASEGLNAEYEVMLTHPKDARGKWAELLRGRVLLCPVPREPAPFAHAPELASQLYTARIAEGAGTITWDGESFAPGTTILVWQGQTFSNAPFPYASGLSAKSYRCWACAYPRLGSYRKAGTQSSGDARYYVPADYVTDMVRVPADTQLDTIIEGRQIGDQQFRIYRVTEDAENVTVYARHIFYDLGANYVVRAVPPVFSTIYDGNVYLYGSLIRALASGGLSSLPVANEELLRSVTDRRAWAPTASTPNEYAIEKKSFVEALLGDDGLLNYFGYELVRDNDMTMVIPSRGKRRGLVLREGVDMLGMSIDTDESDVYTIVVPYAMDDNGNRQLISGNAQASVAADGVESANSGEYAIQRINYLEVDAASLTSGAMTYYAKGGDVPKTTVTIDYIDPRGIEGKPVMDCLDEVYIGDTIGILRRGATQPVEIRVTKIEWDCLAQRYLSLQMGSVDTFGAVKALTGGGRIGSPVIGSGIAIDTMSDADFRALLT